MTYKIVCNSKSIEILCSIIKNEELDVACKLTVNALGDTIIEASGEKEEIKTLIEIFEMVV